MLSYDLANKLDALLSYLNDEGIILSSVAPVSRAASILKNGMIQVFGSNNNERTLSEIKILKKRIQQDTDAAIQKVPLQQIILEVDRFKSASDSLIDEISEHSEQKLPNLTDSLQSFLLAIEERFRKPTDIHTNIHLLQVGQTTYNTILFTRSYLAAVRDGLRNTPLPGRDEESLVLEFDISSDMTALVDILDAMQDLYLGSCAALGVSSEDHPMRVQKVETGCLLFMGIGKKDVIRFCRLFLHVFTRWFVSKHIVPTEAEAVDKFGSIISNAIDLKTKATEAGIDLPADFDKRIEMAFDSYLDNVCRTVRRESMVKIEGELINLFSESTRYLPNRGQQPRIGSDE